MPCRSHAEFRGCENTADSGLFRKKNSAFIHYPETYFNIGSMQLHKSVDNEIEFEYLFHDCCSPPLYYGGFTFL